MRADRELDVIFQDILSGLSAAGIQRTAMSVGKVVRQLQTKRIRSQVSPEGQPWEKRKRRIMRIQKGVKFIWKDGQVRNLKNWSTSQGCFGQKITGYDTDAGGIRTFYKADIGDYLEINTQRVAARASRRSPMFEKLRTARFLRIIPDTNGVSVGFQGRAARIARVHQFGEVGLVSPGNATKYPVRELLGLNEKDKQQITETVIAGLGKAAK
ncbi:phage virion morphogenesis protein [Escherichia coli]|jgi:phage virion morphogenesis protein|uniref:Phage virion morphogenesis protein n=6 Tax=Escherichia coli TaxID=562 RepID=A0A377D4D6_ECOLX|nr:phage virion morphogenesis protein [Escherichia coli]ODQ13566.1 phage virion morphogenesis protein [Shigella sp. FC569]EAA2066841.1 phage virion morphogenesis protein [Escherichia coli]EAB5455410.1 phage virion morphogenesis protein [Escherichia coli]EEQ1721553.1 phage virion morphogenesis protein [Escherichia coli]EEQ7238659.1 phage virion morphogenesis protein [Escherichia coli]